MKTLFLAAAAVLAIGAGMAQAETGDSYGWDQPTARPAGQVVKTSMTQTAPSYATNAQAVFFHGNG